MSGFQRPHCQAPQACAARKPTTHCRPCAARAVAANPEHRARQVAGIRAKAAEPEHRAQLIERANQRLAEVRERLGPEWMKEQGRRAHVHSQSPESLAKLRASAAERGRKRTNTVLAWCPPHKRDDYLHLIRSKRIPAAEARAIIEADVANEGPRIVARITADMHAREARRKAEAY